MIRGYNFFSHFHFCFSFLGFLIILGVAVFWPETAYAYIGPAIAFVGYLLGPVAAIIALVIMIIAWPARILWKKYRAKKENHLHHQEKTASEKNKNENKNEKD